MNLQKQKADTITPHVCRILGATKVTIRESTNKDISGIVIETPIGTVDFSRSQYGNELDIFATVPETEFTVTFQAFGSDITKGFKTEAERDKFVETLPEETKATAKTATRTV